ncbi:MAG: OmpA family protein [Deltaproteobacteria bacterium]|nr:OmpA family protein [Deltaproteobacteria bacterium]
MHTKLWTIALCLSLTALAVGCTRPIRIDSNSNGTTFSLGEAEEHVHVEEGRITIDRHINFATNEATILEDSFDLLDYIAVVLENHSEITALHVVGHTDDVGSDADNQALSERRAEAVVNALRQRGVHQTLDHRGAGEAEPLCQEDTDDCRAQNRRVDFITESQPEG